MDPEGSAAGSSPAPRDSAVLAPTQVPLRPPTTPERGPATQPRRAAGRAPLTPAARARRRTRIILLVALLMVLSGAGLATATYYVDSVPTPAQLALPESTTVYFADGRTPMAKLGTENRTILRYDEMNEAVKQTIVAAEDRTFWTNKGVDLRSVFRAAWNNVTGGDTQGASTITQQYARLAADLKGVTLARKVREAVIAFKLDDRYSKEEILEFYLNTVPFGRGAYGIEAAAQAFFGKTANRNAAPANQVTVSEAMVLAAMVKQPEADPNNPEASPGYDPTRSPVALANSKARWGYVKEGMVGLGYLTQAQADALTYPETVVKFDAKAHQSGLDLPTGLVVQHALSELCQTDAFRDKPADYLRNGGFRIITTIDKRVQDAAEAAADITRPTAPAAVRGQPSTWQAALVAVEPGTGRVLGYFGGRNGAGADFAGWYFDEDGTARGFGQHPPGSSFKVYDLAEALRQNISMKSRWDSPATKEFPASGRTKSSPAGPIRNASTAACQPNCQLWEATVASLNVTFFGLTEKLGTGNVIDMAIRAGIDSMWTTVEGKAGATRIELRGKPGQEVAQHFSTEVGIGQYGITVLDHANGMATFAAGGKRSDAHFVRSVTRNGRQIYGERPTQTDVGLGQQRINQLNWTLKQVEAAKLTNGWDSAGKTGTWQHGTSLTENAHTWMVGYTGALAAAVWLGTTDGTALVTRTGARNVFGANYPGPVWRQFMAAATQALELDRNRYRFGAPSFPPESTAPVSVTPAPPSPTPSTPRPSPSRPSSAPPPPASVPPSAPAQRSGGP